MPIDSGAVDVALAWLGLPLNHPYRPLIEGLWQDGHGWGSIKRQTEQLLADEKLAPRAGFEHRDLDRL